MTDVDQLQRGMQAIAKSGISLGEAFGMARTMEWGDPRSVEQIADAYELSARCSRARRYLDRHDNERHEARRHFFATLAGLLAFLAVALLLAFAIHG
jgi:hypothetical protein